MSKSYGVNKQVEDLVQLSRELKDLGVQVQEATEGARVVKKLRNLGVEASKLDTFIEGLYLEADVQGLKSGEIVSLGLEMRRLKNETGLSYLQVVEENKSLKETNARLKNENEKLESDRIENIKMLERKLVDNKATMVLLNWFSEVKKGLGESGVKIEELEELKTLMENLKESSYEPEPIIEFYSRTRDLQKLVMDLESVVESLRMKKERFEKQIEEYEVIIKEKDEFVQSLDELKRTELTPERIRKLVEKIKEISARHGMTVSNAMEKFYSDLDSHYEAKLGYENQLERLTSKIKTIREEVEDKERRLKVINEIYESRNIELETLNKLNQRDVSNEDLAHWKEILGMTGTDIASFKREMEDLGGIKRLVHEREANVRTLEERIKELRVEIGQQQENLRFLESRLKGLTSKVATEVEENLIKFSNVIDELREELLAPETGLKAKSVEIVKETHKGLMGSLQATKKSWEERIEELKKEIMSLVEEIEEARKMTYEVAKMIGHYHALESIYNILKGADLERSEVLFTMHTFIDACRRWCYRNEEEGLKTACSSFQMILEREIKIGEF